jgi:hypothetical protein
VDVVPVGAIIAAAAMAGCQRWRRCRSFRISRLRLPAGDSPPSLRNARSLPVVDRLGGRREELRSISLLVRHGDFSADGAERERHGGGCETHNHDQRSCPFCFHDFSSFGKFAAPNSPHASPRLERYNFRITTGRDSLLRPVWAGTKNLPHAQCIGFNVALAEFGSRPNVAGGDRKRRSTALRDGRAPTGAATMIETVM